MMDFELQSHISWEESSIDRTTVVLTGGQWSMIVLDSLAFPWIQDKPLRRTREHILGLHSIREKKERLNSFMFYLEEQSIPFMNDWLTIGAVTLS
jgi:hypothetical protein